MDLPIDGKVRQYNIFTYGRLMYFACCQANHPLHSFQSMEAISTTFHHIHLHFYVLVSSVPFMSFKIHRKLLIIFYYASTFSLVCIESYILESCQCMLVKPPPIGVYPRQFRHKFRGRSLRDLYLNCQVYYL